MNVPARFRILISQFIRKDHYHMLIALLVLASLFLAYTNGANDNFKGVATLYGSNILGYRSAITLATITTFLGSLCAIFIANGLIASFSGKGLVPQEVAGSTQFLISVGFGAGFTVLLATLLGFPISTTHSLVGGLVGAGVMAVGFDLQISRLGSTYIIPLLVSPFIAFALSAIVYSTFTRIRRRLGLTKESCICIGEQKQFVPVRTLSAEQNASVAHTAVIDHATPQLVVADKSVCVDLYTDHVFGISVQKVVDAAHIVSGAAVSFARGLNDTPKIAGLLVAIQLFDIRLGMVAIAVGMAIGGLIHARRIAETMSHKITEINHGQGVSANLATSFLVIVASKFGIPVSTTHVSVGSIFGIGVVTRKQNTKVVRGIILSWIITLPLAMAASSAMYWLLSTRV